MILTGVTYKADSPIGKMYITINQDEKNDPFEVFINHGKSGSDLMAMADALGRMISFVLRIHSPVPARERMREIVSEITGIGGARSVGFGENRVRSVPDAIAKVLAKHYSFRVNGKVEDRQTLPSPTDSGNGMGETHSNGNGHSVNVAEVNEQQLPLPETGVVMAAATSSTSLFDLCPECGSGTLAYEEGCKKCYACGYSEC
jgi:ribonucleoside-diphosphate reductase alpha chain